MKTAESGDNRHQVFCRTFGSHVYACAIEDPRSYTSRVGTLALEAILLACFFYLAAHKPYGLALWGGVVTVLLVFGIPLSRRLEERQNPA